MTVPAEPYGPTPSAWGGARLVEPFRGVERPRDMWRSVLLGVVLAGLLAGCSRDGANGGLQAANSSGVVAPSDAKAAQLVEQIPIRSLPPLTSVTCRVKALRATCIGRLVDGTPVHARLRVASNGSLVPFCHSSGDTAGINNIFCTSRPEQYLRKNGG
jgi:hypothetical protein